jgi:predicted nucleic acid-binding protein
MLDYRRDAALIDTGFLLVLLDPGEHEHEIAELFWNEASTVAYTTPPCGG